MNKPISSQEEILANAHSLLLQEGEKGFSLRGLSKMTGISLGAVYSYYRSKDEIIGALMQDFWKKVFLNGLCQDDLSSLSSLEILTRVSSLLLKNYSSFSSLFSLSAKGEAPKGMFASPYIVHFVNQLANVLKKEDPNGLVFSPPMDPASYARFAFASLIGGTLRGDNDVFLSVHKELLRRVNL